MPFSLRAQFPWPVTPFNQSQTITGTFCEYRDTAPAPHYHNGTDIPKADGSPVYPVIDGVVTSLDPNGDNAFVRVNRFAYVHLMPNPALGVGDSVFKSVTVLGTILPGLGHVHLTEGQVNSEVNALRENTGLSPYIDTWPPVINYVRFFQNGTGVQFTNNSVSGRVDIVAHISEKNGPPGSSTSVLNNGTYKLGYKILSADRSTVVYSPPNNGLRYQFDRKPTGDVHNTFHPSFSNTSTHVYYVTNTPTTKTYWDTSMLPEDDYAVMVFTEDTHRNADTVYVPVRVTRKDQLAPAQPTLLTLTRSPAPVFAPVARWQANTEVDLFGYRLYTSQDNVTWTLLSSENQLPKTTTQVDLSHLVAGNYFRLTAVDTVAHPNESLNSDVYGIASSAHSERLLIVDGFDRFGGSGSWQQSWHWFVFYHGQALAANGFAFETCANEAVISGAINLQDYQAVFWLLGDESTTDETFSANEQARVRAYLQNGGNLFVSGSEVAWDLDTQARGSATDEAFLRDYLKVDYVNDDANNFSVSGVAGSIFAGINFTYGSTPYPEDFPDAINAVGGGAVCLRYGNGLNAGVQFAGVFPGGNRNGKLVYLGFPFETISAAPARQEVMRRVLAFFFATTEVAAADRNEGVPKQFVLSQNYPNPFLRGAKSPAIGGGNSATMLRFGLPARSLVQLEIYNLIGQRVRNWPASWMEAGFHEQQWDGRNEVGLPVSSGEYFLRVSAESAGGEKLVRTVRMSLVK
ncbi:MAG: FlgD immunoglobulin-like domain containing protein [bacterium]